MSENTVILPRAMKAAIEFNVSKDTLVEFLASKGFSHDDMQRDFKLTPDMYRVAQAEFQQDKAAKAKAQQVELSKASGETKKKKDEEDLSIKKKEAAKPKEEKPAEEKKAEVKETPQKKKKLK